MRSAGSPQPSWAHRSRPPFTAAPTAPQECCPGASATQTQTFPISGSGTAELRNPCTGGTGTLSYAYQGVIHVTELDSGLFQSAGSTTGTWTLLPDDPTQPSYAGQTASFFAQTFLNCNSGWTATSSFHVVLHGSDGSLLRFRVLLHVTADPDGTVTSDLDVDEVSCL